MLIAPLQRDYKLCLGSHSRAKILSLCFCTLPLSLQLQLVILGLLLLIHFALGRNPILAYCTFGCHVYALPPWCCSAKYVTNICTGIFMVTPSPWRMCAPVTSPLVRSKWHSIFLLMRLFMTLLTSLNAQSLASLKCDAPAVIDTSFLVPDLFSFSATTNYYHASLVSLSR